MTINELMCTITDLENGDGVFFVVGEDEVRAAQKKLEEAGFTLAWSPEPRAKDGSFGCLASGPVIDRDGHEVGGWAAQNAETDWSLFINTGTKEG
jgi:hypothetical protein